MAKNFTKIVFAGTNTDVQDSSVTAQQRTGNKSLEAKVTAFTGRSNRSESYTFTPSTDSSAKQTLTVTQTGKAEYINGYKSQTDKTITNTQTFRQGAVRDSQSVYGISNAANLKLASTDTVISGVVAKLYINNTQVSGWDGISNFAVGSSYGTSAEYEFRIDFTTPENESGTERKHIVTITDTGSDTSVNHGISVTITQNAGTKVYSTPVIDSITYPQLGAGASTVSPTITYHQDWYWNGTKGTPAGTITSGGTLSYTKKSNETKSGSTYTLNSATTGSLSATTLGQYTSLAAADERDCVKIGVTVALNGKTSAEKEVSVSRQHNSVTHSEPKITGGTVDDIPAWGGTVSSFSGYTITQTRTYTSGATATDNIVGRESYSTAVTASHLSMSVKPRTKVGSLTLTVTSNGKQSSKTLDVYQAKNAIKSYDPPKINFDASYPSTDWAASGQSYNLFDEAILTQMEYYDSYNPSVTGDAKGSYLRDIDDTATKVISQKAAVSGFSTNTTTGVVTASNNTTEAKRGAYTVTLSISSNGKTTSKECSFTQAAGKKVYNDGTLTVTYPKILAKGGTFEPTVSASQGYTWNGVAGSGTTVTYTKAQLQANSELRFEITSQNTDSINESTGVITATSLGKTTRSAVDGTVDVSAVLNGITIATEVDLVHEANVLTWANPEFSNCAVTDIPASGGSRAGYQRLFVGQRGTWTSEETEAQTLTISNGVATERGIAESELKYSTAVSVASLETTEKSRTQVGTLTVSLTHNGKTGSTSLPIYQEANTATYGVITTDSDSTFNFPTSYTFSNGTQAGSYTISLTSPKTIKQTVSYTSGKTRPGSLSIKAEKVGTDGRLTVATVTANKQYTVNVGASPYSTTTDIGTVKVSVTGEGNKTASVNVAFKQAKGTTTLSLSKNTLTADYAGNPTSSGSLTFSITSNDTWTIA